MTLKNPTQLKYFDVCPLKPEAGRAQEKELAAVGSGRETPHRYLELAEIFASEL